MPRSKRGGVRCTITSVFIFVIAIVVFLQIATVSHHHAETTIEPPVIPAASPLVTSMPPTPPPAATPSPLAHPRPPPPPSHDDFATEPPSAQPPPATPRLPLDTVKTRVELASLLVSDTSLLSRGAFVKAHAGDVPSLPIPPGDKMKKIVRVRRNAPDPPQGSNEAVLASIAGGGAQGLVLSGAGAHEGVSDGSLDFVYLEYRHDSCDLLQDLYDWWPKVRWGGYLAGSDYVTEHEGKKLTRRNQLDECGAWGQSSWRVLESVDDFRRSQRLLLSVTQEERPSWLFRKGASQAALELPARAGTPKHLHFIWICSKFEDPCELPKFQQEVIEGWRSMHKDYQVTVWDNAKVKQEFAEQIPILNKVQIIAWVADILRYGILYRYGGVYLDTDTIALKRIDPLIEGDSPFGVCELPMSRWGMRYEQHCRFMCNGIIGSPPGEEMFRYAFETAQYNVQLAKPKMKVSWITGPKLFTNASGWNITVLGATTFLPCSWKDTTICDIDKFRKMQNVFAMHSWNPSWAPKARFQNDSQWVPIWDRKKPKHGKGGANSEGGKKGVSGKGNKALTRKAWGDGHGGGHGGARSG